MAYCIPYMTNEAPQALKQKLVTTHSQLIQNVLMTYDCDSVKCKGIFSKLR